MRVTKVLPADQFRNALAYDPTTGFLIRRSTGKRACRVQTTKKRRDRQIVLVKLCGRDYIASRVVWTMVVGTIPPGIEIDHRDLDSTNNRIDNLRLATSSQNQANRRVRRDSAVKVKGVSKRGDGRYYAFKRVNGRLKYLGTFRTAETAHAAYLKAAIKSHGEFARSE